MLDDGTGTAVGYCIGCPDTRAFAAAYPSYVSSVLDASDEVREQLRGSDPPRPALRPETETETETEPWTLEDGSVNGACLVQMAYDPQRLLAVEAAVSARFPATLHIDLLGEWQGRGWGARLLERTVRALEEEGQGSADASVEGGGGGGGGVWVGVAADNAKVVPFYEKMGFRLWGDDEREKEKHEGEHISSNDSNDSNDRQRGESSEAGPGDGGSIVLVREFLGGAGLRPGKAGGAL